MPLTTTIPGCTRVEHAAVQAGTFLEHRQGDGKGRLQLGGVLQPITSEEPMELSEPDAGAAKVLRGGVPISADWDPRPFGRSPLSLARRGEGTSGRTAGSAVSRRVRRQAIRK